MTKQIKIILLAVMLTFVMVMVWLFDAGQAIPSGGKTIYVSSDWEKKFEFKDKVPYGLYLFNALLRAQIDSTKKIQSIVDEKGLDSLPPIPSTFVFVGDQFGLKNEELKILMDKVNLGSDLFLSYNNLTDNINELLFKHIEISYDYADSVNVFVGNTHFSHYYLYQNDTIAYQWKGIQSIEPVDTVYQTLSSFMEMSNFIRIKHGKGFIYLHTNPEFFFNYQIKRNDGFRYASFVINQFDKHRPIFLLELGRLLEDSFAEEDSTETENAGKQDDSYLQFLLKSPALVAAMALTIFGLLLFLIFRARRMRPIVPFLAKKKNMSLEFVETITSIYVAKQYPYGLLQLQKKNFYETVQKHYFVDFSRASENRDKELKILSEKSTIPEEELVKLLQLLETKVTINVTDEYIVNVAKKQREFYETTGLISAKVLQKVNALSGTIKREMVLSSFIVLTGVLVILIGFYFLTKAIGVGIVLWPIGAAILTIGIARLSKPLLKYDRERLLYYPLFGTEKAFNTNELMTVAATKSGVILNFTEGRSLAINYREMSSFDRGQIHLFIAANQQFKTE